MVGEIAAKSQIENVLSTLIYEMDDGKPIYYLDDKDFLNKTRTLEQIMGTNILQSQLI
jgi:hypothetical protein